MQRCSVVIRRSWQSVQTYFVLFSEARKEDLHDLSPDMSITKLGGSQRFVPSIGNIENAMWVFNCLGRPGHFSAVLKFLQLKLKYASFQGGFHGHSSVCTKKLLKIKLRQLIVNFIFFSFFSRQIGWTSTVNCRGERLNFMFTVLDTNLWR